jgi:hypothetical protein
LFPPIASGRFKAIQSYSQLPILILDESCGYINNVTNLNALPVFYPILYNP